MRTIYAILLLILLGSSTAFAQLDRSKAPFSSEAPQFDMPKAKTFVLDNGLTLIVVENHKVPRVSFEIYIDRGPIFEGQKVGYTQAVGQLMRAGTTHKTKDELNEAIDFLGANLAVSSQGISASSLSKYSDQLLQIMQDVLLHPLFPEEELDLFKKQQLSALSANKSQASAIASRVKAAALYGKNHPYGELSSEKHLQHITLDDIKNYYATYFRPNAAYLIVVGDISAKKAKKVAKKYFGAWKAKPFKKASFGMPQEPKTNQVVIAHKPGAVQTQLSLSHVVDLKPGHPDIYAIKLLQSILGGGSDGRLYKNIREDKGYAYGAYCSFSSDLLVGNFSASASVRNAVTDSAIVEFLTELKRIQTTKVSPDELALHKAKFIGSYARSLENPATLARFALTIERYGLPANFYENYLTKLNEQSADDILRVAQQYLKPEKLWIVAVGDRAVLKKLMPKFSTDKIHELDFYGEPLTQDTKPVPTGVSAQSVIEKYLKAINGKAWQNVRHFTASGVMQFTGVPLPLEITMQAKPTDKINVSVSALGNIMMQQVLNGEKGIGILQGKRSPLTTDEIADLRQKAILIEEFSYLKPESGLALTGIEQHEGKDCYVLRVQKPMQKTIFYALASGLKVKELVSRKTPSGPLTEVRTMSKYKKVGDMLFPHVMNTQVEQEQIHVEFKTVDVQTPIDDSVFTLE